jgi:hypothetical protein
VNKLDLKIPEITITIILIVGIASAATIIEPSQTSDTLPIQYDISENKCQFNDDYEVDVLPPRELRSNKDFEKAYIGDTVILDFKLYGYVEEDLSNCLENLESEDNSIDEIKLDWNEDNYDGEVTNPEDYEGEGESELSINEYWTTDGRITIGDLDGLLNDNWDVKYKLLHEGIKEKQGSFDQSGQAGMNDAINIGEDWDTGTYTIKAKVKNTGAYSEYIKGAGWIEAGEIEVKKPPYLDEDDEYPECEKPDGELNFKLARTGDKVAPPSEGPSLVATGCWRTSSADYQLSTLWIARMEHDTNTASYGPPKLEIPSAKEASVRDGFVFESVERANEGGVFRFYYRPGKSPFVSTADVVKSRIRIAASTRDHYSNMRPKLGGWYPEGGNNEGLKPVKDCKGESTCSPAIFDATVTEEADPPIFDGEAVGDSFYHIRYGGVASKSNKKCVSGCTYNYDGTESLEEKKEQIREELGEVDNLNNWKVDRELSDPSEDKEIEEEGPKFYIRSVNHEVEERSEKCNPNKFSVTIDEINDNYNILESDTYNLKLESGSYSQNTDISGSLTDPGEGSEFPSSGNPGPLTVESPQGLESGTEIDVYIIQGTIGDPVSEVKTVEISDEGSCLLSE